MGLRDVLNWHSFVTFNGTILTNIQNTPQEKKMRLCKTQVYTQNAAAYLHVNFCKSRVLPHT